MRSPFIQYWLIQLSISFFAYGNLFLEFYEEITIKFLPLSSAAWAHCQMSIMQLSFTGLKKESE